MDRHQATATPGGHEAERGPGAAVLAPPVYGLQSPVQGMGPPWHLQPYLPRGPPAPGSSGHPSVGTAASPLEHITAGEPLTTTSCPQAQPCLLFFSFHYPGKLFAWKPQEPQPGRATALPAPRHGAGHTN